MWELSLYHVGTQDWTSVIKLGGQPRSHITNPISLLLCHHSSGSFSLENPDTGSKTIKGHHMSSGNFKLKPETTIHLLEWPRSKILPTHQILVTMYTKQKLSFVAGVDAAWRRGRWAVSCRAKQALIRLHRVCSLFSIQRRGKCTSIEKPVYGCS